MTVFEGSNTGTPDRPGLGSGPGPGADSLGGAPPAGQTAAAAGMTGSDLWWLAMLTPEGSGGESLETRDYAAEIKVRAERKLACR